MSLPSSPISSKAAYPLHGGRPVRALATVRTVSRLHRWLGTGFALLFVLWFASGFVMMYVPFPSLGEARRIAASRPVQLDAVRLAPADAVRGLAAQRLRLLDVLGQPRYLAYLEDGSVRSIAADGSGVSPPLHAAAAGRLATQFAGWAVRDVSGPFDYDQWVVHQRFDAARPFYRVALADAAGTELYVSARLGQVLQRTTRFERGWNWVGAVVHWIYPTVLRKSHAAWDQVVWWLALAALGVAASGYALGLVRLTHLRRGSGKGWSPFRGWLRWHHLLGLVGGLAVLSWVASGWLSMDHGRLFSVDQPGAHHAARWRGADLASVLDGLEAGSLRSPGGVREVEFFAVGGQGFAMRHGVVGAAARLLPLAGGKPQAPLAALPDALLSRAAAAAWAPLAVRDIVPIAAHDPYAHTRSDPLPPGARRVRLADPGTTWVHVDASSGRIVSTMDDSRRLYRWLFAGLHSFDVPALNHAGPLREALMLAALAAGLALSVSGLVLGVKRLRRGKRPTRRGAA